MVFPVLSSNEGCLEKQDGDSAGCLQWMGSFLSAIFAWIGKLFCCASDTALADRQIVVSLYPDPMRELKRKYIEEHRKQLQNETSDLIEEDSPLHKKAEEELINHSVNTWGMVQSDTSQQERKKLREAGFYAAYWSISYQGKTLLETWNEGALDREECLFQEVLTGYKTAIRLSEKGIN